MNSAAEGQAKPHLVENDQAAAALAAARRLLYSGSLAEVVANRAQINALVDSFVRLEGYGSIPEDIWEMLTMLDDIVAGKVDRVAALIEQGIPAHRAALAASYKEQDERLALAGDRLKGLLTEAVQLAGTPIAGLYWKARLQANSQPSVVVEDSAKVPDTLKRRRFSMSFDYPVSAKIEKAVQVLIAAWTSDKATVLGVTGAKGSVVDLVPAKPIADAWKAADAKAKPVVPGVQVIHGSHLRLDAVNGKPGAIAKPIPLKLTNSDTLSETF